MNTLAYMKSLLQMECAQINIKGGKATSSPQTYSIPGIYKV